MQRSDQPAKRGRGSPRETPIVNSPALKPGSERRACSPIARQRRSEHGARTEQSVAHRHRVPAVRRRASRDRAVRQRSPASRTSEPEASIRSTSKFSWLCRNPDPGSAGAIQFVRRVPRIERVKTAVGITGPSLPTEHQAIIAANDEVGAEAATTTAHSTSRSRWHILRHRPRQLSDAVSFCAPVGAARNSTQERDAQHHHQRHGT